ncbi:hypothetical protein ACFL13_00480 [Patescibacteria group bacterium]
MMTLYYTLLFIFLVSFSSLIFIVLYIIYTHIAESRFRKNSAKGSQEEAYSEALKIVDTARKESLQIVKSANRKAQDILSESRELHNYVEEGLTKKLNMVARSQAKHFEELTHNVFQKYRQTMEVEKDIALKEFKLSFNEIKGEMLMELEKFVEVLKIEVAKTKGSLEEKVNQELVKTNEEIKRYKDQKLKEVDGTLRSTVDQATQDILRRSMTNKDHENLILNALETIKNSEKFKRI